MRELLDGLDQCIANCSRGFDPQVVGRMTHLRRNDGAGADADSLQLRSSYPECQYRDKSGVEK